MSKNRKFLQNAKQELVNMNFQAVQAEEEQRLLQGLLWQQKLEYREVHQRGLTEMEELRKFQSSAFDTMKDENFIDAQNTRKKLSGRVQELQNEKKSYERFEGFSGC